MFNAMKPLVVADLGKIASNGSCQQRFDQGAPRPPAAARARRQRPFEPGLHALQIGDLLFNAVQLAARQGLRRAAVKAIVQTQQLMHFGQRDPSVEACCGFCSYGEVLAD